MLSRLPEGTTKMKFFGVKEFFSGIMISKMGVKMNFRITTKNHAADSKIESSQKSILEPMGLTSTQSRKFFACMLFLILQNQRHIR